MKVKAFIQKKSDEMFTTYEIPSHKPFVEFYESTAIQARPLNELEYSTGINIKRYYVYTSERDGEQYLFTEDFVRLVQSLRPYSKGDEHSFVNKMRRRIMEKEKV